MNPALVWEGLGGQILIEVGRHSGSSAKAALPCGECANLVHSSLPASTSFVFKKMFRVHIISNFAYEVRLY